MVVAVDLDAIITVAGDVVKVVVGVEITDVVVVVIGVVIVGDVVVDVVVVVVVGIVGTVCVVDEVVDRGVVEVHVSILINVTFTSFTPIMSGVGLVKLDS